MATERLTIKVSQRGAKVTSKQIGGIARGAIVANQALQLTQQVLAGVAAAIRALTGPMDVFTNMQNRLKLVTHSTQNLADVTRDLERVASNTRQAFASTADVYSRVALSVKTMGATQQQTMKFVENLNKAIVLSGASAVEASAGMIQLAQGLASNRLSGDELRSVLEQLPKVADLIAKHLKVTRGELRALGKAGKLEAKVVFDAIRLADAEVAVFDDTTATFAQTITQLKNKYTLWVGELDRSHGITQMLNKALTATVEWLMDVVTAVGEVVAGWVEFIKQNGLLMMSLETLGTVLGASTQSLKTTLWVLEKITGLLPVMSGGIGTMVGWLTESEGEAKSVEEAMNRWLPSFSQIPEAIKESEKAFKSALPHWLALTESTEKSSNSLFDFKNIALDAVARQQDAADTAKEATKQTLYYAEAIDQLRKAGVENDDFDPISGFSNKELRDMLSGVTLDGGKGQQQAVDQISAKFQVRKLEAAEAKKLMEARAVVIGKVVKSMAHEAEVLRATTDAEKKGIQTKHKMLEALKVEAVGWGTLEWIILQVAQARVREATEAGKVLDLDKKFASLQTDLDRRGEILRATDAEKAAVRIKHEMVDALGMEASQWGLVARSIFQASVALAKEEAAAAKSSAARSKYTSGRKAAISALEALRRSVDSVTAAEGQLLDIEKDLNTAIKFKLISQEDALALGNRIKDSMADQLNPLQALVDQLKAEGDAIDEGTDAKRRRVKVEQALAQFAGTSYDGAIPRAVITAVVLGQDDMRQATDRATAAITAQWKAIDKVSQAYEQKVNTINDAIATGQDDVRLAREQVAIRKLLADGLEGEAWKQLLLNDAKAKGVKLSQETLDVISKVAIAKQLQADADAIEKLANAATIQGEIIKQAFSGMADVIADFVAEGDFSFENFKESFNQLVESLLRDMTRMLIMRAFFAGLGGGDAAANILGTTPPGIGAATGGSFIVPGSGGPDSQVTMLRTTPGERVSVETNSQQKKNDAPQGGGGPAQVFVLSDPRQFDAAFATASFDRHVVRVMADNPTIMRRFNRTR